MKHRIQDIQHEENDADVPEEKDRVGFKIVCVESALLLIVFGDLLLIFCYCSKQLMTLNLLNVMVSHFLHF